MKTWETYSRERFASGISAGVKVGREEGRKELAREMMDILDKRPPGEKVDALREFLSNIIENVGGESRRPRN